MKFYDCATAPSPRRVRIFLAEKGVTLETIQVDLSKGEQFSEAFKKINPSAQVPLLQLDDCTCITEVSAICRYLEEIYPQTPLYGRTPVERAQVESFNTQL
jgi:glutathione S-transferase